MEALLIISDDGIERELRWDKQLLAEHYSIYQVHFARDQSCLGTCRTDEGARVMSVSETGEHELVVDMTPLDFADWLLAGSAWEGRRFSNILLGIDSGLNPRGPGLVSSGLMAIASRLCEMAEKVVAVSVARRATDLDTEEAEFLNRVLLRVFEEHRGRFILSINSRAEKLQSTQEFRHEADANMEPRVFHEIATGVWKTVPTDIDESGDTLTFELLSPWSYTVPR